jgi:hypothetical protein
MKLSRSNLQQNEDSAKHYCKKHRVLTYIPMSLDIDKHIENFPPTNIEYFQRDNLLYIIGLMNYLETDENSGYVHINAKTLKKKVRNYKQYLTYLLDTNVLETDNHYVAGEKSKGYRFTPDYHSKIYEKEISKFTLVRQIKKERQPDPEVESKYSYLTKWWNSNFEIDYSGAVEFLDNCYSSTGSVPTFTENGITTTGAAAVNKFNYSYRGATEFHEQNFRPPSVDSTGNRFHHDLTFMWIEMIQFLRYDGRILGSVDISNSQPYFSMFLLDPDFYKKGANSIFSYISSSSYLSSLSSLLPIMVRNIHELKDNQDIKHYKELVENGLLYKYLEKEIFDELGIKFNTYRALKEEIFKGIYSTNYWIGQPSAGPKRIFRDRFPSVYQMFKILKRINKAHLPVLLQQIESYIVLDVICNRIARERPKLPIWTKHDSIITTFDDILYVESIMHEELTKFIGVAPKLKIERWEKK